ncbi:MAG: tyrosine-type recombinase/integrase [Mogibacterium sp.]|nr:tyrosine-type recombinase/integrase [Mogibacterium sp.]
MDAFIEYLKNTKNKAENTLVAYRRDLNAFETFLKGRGGKTLYQCRESDAVAYILELNNESKSKATINRKISSLRAFYDFKMDEGEVEENPFQKIKSAKNDKRQIEYLTIAEVTAMLDQPDESHKGIRDRALLEFMYGTGARVTEVVRLQFCDINLKMNFVTLKDNDGESRIVPIGSYAHDALVRYIGSAYCAIKGDERTEDDYVFINFRGQALTRQGIWKILKEYGKAVGIEDKMTPQILRNSFAVHILQNGGDLKTLQELMGFEDMSVGIAYLAVLNVRIKDVFNRTHPRA